MVFNSPSLKTEYFFADVFMLRSRCNECEEQRLSLRKVGGLTPAAITGSYTSESNDRIYSEETGIP